MLSNFRGPLLSRHTVRLAEVVHDLISRMHYSIVQVNAMLAGAKKTSYKAAARHFMQTHPRIIKYWATGTLG